MTQQGILRGTVNWFKADKGYGFITYKPTPDSDATEDIFVHFSCIIMTGYRNLHKGDVVEFLVQQGTKGLQAVNVVVIEKAQGQLHSQQKPRKEGRYEGKA